jgi:hypothetical protein
MDRKRIGEVRERAARVLEVLAVIESSEHLGAVGGTLPVEQMATGVEAILRSKIQGEEVDQGAFRSFVRALSAEPPSHPSDYGLKSLELLRRPPGIRPFSERGVADLVNRYLQCFVETPELEKHNPLGVCSRPECQTIFLKSRSDQAFCSTDCRVADWNKKKAAEEPGYWADAARRSRKERERRRRLAARKSSALDR